MLFDRAWYTVCFPATPEMLHQLCHYIHVAITYERVPGTLATGQTTYFAALAWYTPTILYKREHITYGDATGSIFLLKRPIHARFKLDELTHHIGLRCYIQLSKFWWQTNSMLSNIPAIRVNQSTFQRAWVADLGTDSISANIVQHKQNRCTEV